MTRPLWLVCIFLLLCALIGLGVWGVIESSLTEQASRQSTATSAAIETSLTLRSVILGAFQPAITLGTLIATQEPQDWGSVLQTFYQTIPGIFDLSQSAPIINIQLLPNGIVGVIEPDLGFETSIGLDLLRDPASRAIALDGIGRTTLGLIGPQETNASILGIIGRYSIFVPGSHPDATFGFVPPFDRNLYSPSGGNCPIDLCYRNSSVEKFWGFSQVVVGWQDVVSLSGLYNLCGSYQFMMTSSGSSATVEHAHNGMAMAQCSDVTHLPSIFPRIMNGTSGSGTPPSFQSLQPISIPIPIFDQQWTLWIVESQGWVPTWQAPLIAVVVIVGVVFALLVLLLMASFLEQGQTLADLQASNRKLDEARTVLEAEKANTDALIIRHLNLISCFSDEKMNKAHRTSMEVSTLERIEAVRRHLKIGGNDPEEMEVLELLGSGSYGKVYRGLWRGTQVAIKTIVLPANMSGTAKREKMVIMEAAISSALTHPNIVQTYTCEFVLKMICPLRVLQAPLIFTPALIGCVSPLFSEFLLFRCNPANPRYRDAAIFRRRFNWFSSGHC